MQQALALLSAYDAGNFVGFFNVMRRLPYLMACISHRLVVAVRHRAIRTWVSGEPHPSGMSLTLTQSPALVLTLHAHADFD